MSLRTLLLLFALLLPSIAQAQQFGIVAEVNGEAITNFALHDRITLMIRTSGLENSQAVRDKLAGQALQGLINEALQRQDAKVQGITVSDAELNNAIADIEKKNNQPPGSFRNYVSGIGINADSLYDQIRMQVLWKKILSRRVQPQIGVSTFEIDEAMSQLGASKTRSEVYLSEIVLPIPEGQEQDTLQVAQELIREIKAGKDFGKIAKQFSSGSTAENGGLIGWIGEEQLRGALRQQVKNAETNTLLPPVRTDDGYHIVFLKDRRTHVVGGGGTTETDIKNRLLAQKFDLEAKRYIKQLREKSFIDIRL